MSAKTQCKHDACLKNNPLVKVVMIPLVCQIPITST